MSERMELAKLKKEKKAERAGPDSRVYKIEVTGELRAERDVILLGGKK